MRTGTSDGRSSQHGTGSTPADGSLGLLIIGGLAAHSVLIGASKLPFLQAIMALAALAGLFVALLTAHGDHRPRLRRGAAATPHAPASAPAPPPVPHVASHTAPIPREARAAPNRSATNSSFDRAEDDENEKAGVYQVERDAQGRILAVRDLTRPWRPPERATACIVDAPAGMQWPAFPKRRYLN